MYAELWQTLSCDFVLIVSFVLVLLSPDIEYSLHCDSVRTRILNHSTQRSAYFIDNYHEKLGQECPTKQHGSED